MVSIARMWIQGLVNESGIRDREGATLIGVTPSRSFNYYRETTYQISTRSSGAMYIESPSWTPNAV